MAFIEAASGSAAAVVSTAALYPLEIAKSRLVAKVGRDRQRVLEILHEIYKEKGILGLYKGLQLKCSHAVVQSFGYFYLYSLLRNLHKERVGGSIGTGMSLLLGYLAGVGNLGASLPFEVLTMRSQVSDKSMSILQTAKAVVAEGGLPALYKGLAASVILCINPAINIAVFDQLKARLLAWLRRRAPTGKRIVALTAFQAFLVGIIAKTIATLVTYPYIRVKVVMQGASKASAPQGADATPQSAHKPTQQQATPAMNGSTTIPPAPPTPAAAAAAAAAGGGKHIDIASASTLELMQYIIKTEGVAGLYKGIQPQLFRSVLASALMFMAKERIHFYTRKVLLAIMRRNAAEAASA